MFTLKDTITWEEFISFCTYQGAENAIKEVTEDLFIRCNLTVDLIVVYPPNPFEF